MIDTRNIRPLDWWMRIFLASLVTAQSARLSAYRKHTQMWDDTIMGLWPRGSVTAVAHTGDMFTHLIHLRLIKHVVRASWFLFSGLMLIYCKKP